MGASVQPEMSAGKKPPILMIFAILMVVPGALYISWIITEQYANNIYFQSQLNSLQPILLPLIILIAVIIGGLATVLTARKKRAKTRTSADSNPE